MDKAKTLALMLLIVGIGGIAILSPTLLKPVPTISNEAKQYLQNFKVYIKETDTWTSFNPDNQLVRLIFWRQGGTVLSVESWRVPIEWQIVVGLEDAPYNGEGDKCDVILKLIKYPDGGLTYEIACLGGYIKKVYYQNMLLLDMETGQRYASGSL